jgi:hypothetical protein
LSISLTRYYAVRNPGTYKVLIASTAWGETCVAKPVTIRVVEPGTGKPTTKHTAIAEKTLPDFGPGRPTDKDWPALASLAGTPLQGLALDSRRSPVSPDFVIVSLRLGDGEERHEVPAPMTASKSQNYWILVRGPSGQPVPILETARWSDTLPGVLDSLDARKASLCRGDAIGVAIPITRWFEMKEAGEYTILVALPSSERKAPAWVAPPVKFRVEHANELRKKNVEVPDGTKK